MLRDQITVVARSSRPFEMPDYDKDRFDGTRRAVLELAPSSSAASTTGLAPNRRWIPCATPGLPVGEYQLTVRDVPVDGFWSISLYNADGFFEANDRGAHSVNNITATPNEDVSVTVQFGGCGDGHPNCLPIMDGWNYTIRLYRPRSEVLDGSWTFPTIKPD